MRVLKRGVSPHVDMLGSGDAASLSVVARYSSRSLVRHGAVLCLCRAVCSVRVAVAIITSFGTVERNELAKLAVVDDDVLAEVKSLIDISEDKGIITCLDEERTSVGLRLFADASKLRRYAMLYGKTMDVE